MGYDTGVYLRISDDREGRELGVTRQEDDLRAKADREGDRIFDVYKDNDIGASTRSRKKRPDYQRLIEDARNGRIQKITAYTSSRLTRRPREHEDQIELAEKFGILFGYVASPSFDLNTADGRQIARTLAAQDAGESERNSERVTRAKLELALSGQPLGGPRAFGYEPDGITRREPEFSAIATAAEMLLAGVKRHSIGLWLNEQGILTSTGALWKGRSVEQMLLRPRNAALVVRDGEVVAQAVWPAALTEDVWRGVTALLGQRGPHNGVMFDRRYLGTGLYWCGVCDDGTTMILSSGGTPDRPQLGYRCRSKRHPLWRTVGCVDDVVERAAVARLREPDAVQLLARASDAGMVEALHVQATSIRRQLDELDDELDDGVITRDRWARRNSRLTDRLREVEGQLTASATNAALVGLAGNPDVSALWFGTREDRSDGLDLGRRTAAVNALMVVRVMAGRPGRQPGGGYFDPRSVRIEWRV